MRNVLISGAGVAGPALAYWLNRHGMRVTVVERAVDSARVGRDRHQSAVLADEVVRGVREMLRRRRRFGRRRF